MEDINSMHHMDLRMEVIARRFSKAQATYEEHAGLQRKLGEALFERIMSVGRDFPKILDVGCGTGTFSAHLLSLNPRTLVLSDVSCDMITHCRERFKAHKNIGYCVKNAEHDPLLADPLREEHYDLIASNAAVQWFSSLKTGLTNFKDALNPGGLVAFSTFVKGNLEEIREAGGWGLSYLSMDELYDQVSSVFPYSKIIPMTMCMHYPDAHSMLRSLRGSGVTGMSGAHWTPGRLKKFVADYESRFSDDQGVRLTWQAATVLASDEDIKL